MIIATFRRAADDVDAETPPGEDLARDLAQRMNVDGCLTDRLDLHDDYAWSWFATLGGATHYFMLAHFYEGVDGQWMIGFQPQLGFLASLKRKTYQAAAEQLKGRVTALLSSYPGVSEFAWREK
jgi:hypothetical protein